MRKTIVQNVEITGAHIYTKYIDTSLYVFQDDLDRAEATEGAPAGGDARANVRIQTAPTRSSGQLR